MTRLENLVRHLLSAKRKYDFPRTLTPLCSCSDFPLPLQTLFTSNRPLDMAKIPLSSQIHALTSGNIFWSAMYYMQVPWLLETVSWFQDYWAVNSGFRCYCHCEMQLLFFNAFHTYYDRCCQTMDKQLWDFRTAMLIFFYIRIRVDQKPSFISNWKIDGSHKLFWLFRSKTF